MNPPVAREKPETAPCTVCGQEADALVRICEKCDARWRGDEGMLDIRPVPSAAANTDSDPDAAPDGLWRHIQQLHRDVGLSTMSPPRRLDLESKALHSVARRVIAAALALGVIDKLGVEGVRIDVSNSGGTVVLRLLHRDGSLRTPPWTTSPELGPFAMALAVLTAVAETMEGVRMLATQTLSVERCTGGSSRGRVVH